METKSRTTQVYYTLYGENSFGNTCSEVVYNKSPKQIKQIIEDGYFRPIIFEWGDTHCPDVKSTSYRSTKKIVLTKVIKHTEIIETVKTITEEVVYGN